MKIKGVNIRKALVFIASSLTREEVVASGLGKIVPRRRYKHGPSPGVTSPKLWTRMEIKAAAHDASVLAGSDPSSTTTPGLEGSGQRRVQSTNVGGES